MVKHKRCRFLLCNFLQFSLSLKNTPVSFRPARPRRPRPPASAARRSPFTWGALDASTLLSSPLPVGRSLVRGQGRPVAPAFGVERGGRGSG